MESVEVRSSCPVSADVRLMMSHSTRTAGGNTADPTGASEPEAFPAAAEENSPTEKQKKRKKKGIRALCRRIGKAIMRHILCCDGDDIECSDPTDDQDPADQTDPEPSPVPGPSALDSETPGPSGLGPAFEKQKEEKSISPLFRRKWRAIKRSVRRFQKRNKVAPDWFVDEPVAHQDPADLMRQTDPEPSSVSSPSTLDSGITPAAESPVLGPSSREETSVSSLSSLELTPDMGLADPEPKPIPGAIDVGPSGFWPATGSISSYYDVKRELGRGGFGIVHEGTRRFDGQKVAIKFLPKSSWDKFIELPGSTKPLLAEVAVNLLMRKPPKSPHVVQMLDWFDQLEQYALIMEYPHPCETLLRFAMRKGGFLDETVARGLMRQAVLAAKLCVDRGVYHKDIKTDNILVNTETLQLKFIDFGCSELFKTSKGREWVVKSSVWSLGRVLLEIVSGDQPLRVLLSGKLDPLRPSLSKECQDLIMQCLDKYQSKSLTLEQMLEHAWFEQD